MDRLIKKADRKAIAALKKNADLNLILVGPKPAIEEAFQKAVLFPGLLLLLAVVVIPDVIRSLSH